MFACGGYDQGGAALEGSESVGESEATGKALTPAPADAESAAADAEVTEKFLGSDACKDVRIRVYNLYGADIKVTRVEYYDQSDSKWRKEDLGNEVIPWDDNQVWTRDLEYTKEDRLGNWRVYFRIDQGHDPAGLRVWSQVYYQTVTPDEGTGLKCGQGDNFTLRVRN